MHAQCRLVRADFAVDDQDAVRGAALVLLDHKNHKEREEQQDGPGEAEPQQWVGIRSDLSKRRHRVREHSSFLFLKKA